jgi:hypothetical protein
MAVRARKALVRRSKVVTTVNPCIPLAHAAKGQLEPLGWTVSGRAGVDGAQSWAEVTAARGEELLTLNWVDGILFDQKYSLWNTDRPSKNKDGMPDASIPFDIDEISDKELAQELAGRKIIWWNRLGTNQETGTIPDVLKVNHVYSGTGDEVPADRIITFVDRDGGGYRSFRLGALLKVK